QIPLALVMFPLLQRAPRVAFVLFLTSLLIDAVDGALARRRGLASQFGAFFDQFCDYTRETLVIAAMAWVGALSPLLGVLYPMVYGLFNFTLYLCNRVQRPIPW